MKGHGDRHKGTLLPHAPGKYSRAKRLDSYWMALFFRPRRRWLSDDLDPALPSRNPRRIAPGGKLGRWRWSTHPSGAHIEFLAPELGQSPPFFDGGSAHPPYGSRQKLALRFRCNHEQRDRQIQFPRSFFRGRPYWIGLGPLYSAISAYCFPFKSVHGRMEPRKKRKKVVPFPSFTVLSLPRTVRAFLSARDWFSRR